MEKLARENGKEETVIIGGDWNAQVGATKDNKWRNVMGPFGDTR